MNKIEIIKEASPEKPFLIIYKPRALPSAPLSALDKENALSQALELYPELKKVKGKKDIEYGLLHRLDTVTDGLIIIAANQQAYDYLTEEQAQGRIIKYYQALCDYKPDLTKKKEGFPPALSENPLKQKVIHLESYFRPYGKGNKEVRPVTRESNKAALDKVGKKKIYQTQVKILNNTDKGIEVECKITQGFRHQVRCHLAWAGLPIQNDPIYNLDKKNAEEPIKFSANKIEFEYPRGDLNSYDRKDTWT